GGKVKPWFEGGQMPLQRRLPKRGFTNIFKRTFQVVKVGRLDRFEANAVVDPEALEKAGLIRSAQRPVKVLSDGELGKPLVVRAHAFSAAAKEKIEKAGGSAEIIKKSASPEQAQGQEG
ncbi:MAG: 50S ribosomal protein L15, partial [Deltaproteobacteria bacterium]